MERKKTQQEAIMKYLAEQEAEKKKKSQEDAKEATAEIVRQDTPVVNNNTTGEINSNDEVINDAPSQLVSNFSV